MDILSNASKLSTTSKKRKRTTQGKPKQKLIWNVSKQPWICKCPIGPVALPKDQRCTICKEKVSWKCNCGTTVRQGSRKDHILKCPEWNKWNQETNSNPILIARWNSRNELDKSTDSIIVEERDIDDEDNEDFQATQVEPPLSDKCSTNSNESWDGFNTLATLSNTKSIAEFENLTQQIETLKKEKYNLEGELKAAKELPTKLFTDLKDSCEKMNAKLDAVNTATKHTYNKEIKKLREQLSTLQGANKEKESLQEELSKLKQQTDLKISTLEGLLTRAIGLLTTTNHQNNGIYIYGKIDLINTVIQAVNDGLIRITDENVEANLQYKEISQFNYEKYIANPQQNEIQEHEAAIRDYAPIVPPKKSNQSSIKQWTVRTTKKVTAKSINKP